MTAVAQEVRRNLRKRSKIRSISATHEAQASIRIMPICCCLGEAAGTAVAIAHNTNKNAHTVDVNALQKKLVENGAVL